VVTDYMIVPLCYLLFVSWTSSALILLISFLYQRLEPPADLVRFPLGVSLKFGAGTLSPWLLLLFVGRETCASHVYTRDFGSQDGV
jgi:hypothetical protein